MPRPAIEFKNDDEVIRYGLQALSNAGIGQQQIDSVRYEAGKGQNKIPYSKELVGQRRYMVQELLAANLSNSQIATVLKLSKETVNADRHHNRDIWTAEILKSQDTWRARLIQEQDLLKEKALNAFENSRKKVITTTSDRGDSVRVEESAGESGFLGVARSCLEQQARLLGLFDVKVQAEDKGGYKQFLDTLGAEVKKIQQAESNSGLRTSAIDTTAKAEFDDDGQPVGSSRPLLSANDEDNKEEGDGESE